MKARQSSRDLASYGLPALSVDATMWVSSLYLVKFATETLWIAPAVVGAILGLSRVWDAVSDPLIGYASDRTRTRIGRRRPWMLAGAPLLALCFAGLWTGAGDAGTTSRALAFALATVGFYSAVTLVDVPHASLGASLARDPHERNRLFAARGVFKNLGLGVALVALYQLEGSTSLAETATSVGLWLGAGAAAIIALGVWLTNEPEASCEQPRSSVGAIRDVAAHTGARRILGVLGLQELALGALLVVLPFASDYILEAPGQTAFYLIAFVVPLTLSLPVWVRVGRRLGEYRAWRVGNAIEVVGFLPLVLIGPGDGLLVMAAAGCIGIGHGAGRVLAMTALARTADDDAERTGEAKEGLYFAASNFVQKLAAGLAALAVGVALQASGFQAGSGPTEATVWVLRGVASVFPALVLTASCVVLAGGIREPLGTRARGGDVAEAAPDAAARVLARGAPAK